MTAPVFVSVAKEVRQHSSDLPVPSEIKDCVRKWLKRRSSHGQLPMAENPSLHSLDEFKMGQMTEQLIDVLDQLAIVLESDGATDWSQWMRKAKAHLMNSDYYGVEYLLSAFGGMGSFNDLILGQHHVDGVWAWKPGHVELNTRFDALRSEAAALASAIKRTQQN